MEQNRSARMGHPIMGSSYIEVETQAGCKKLRLSDTPLTIGRHPDNALVIKDNRASRFHCVVEPVDSGFQLRDLESRNGTKLNDDRVTKVVLNPGDTFRIGKTIFRFFDPNAVPIDLAPDEFGGGAESERDSFSFGGDQVDYNAMLESVPEVEAGSGNPMDDLAEVAETANIGGKDHSTPAEMQLVNTRGQLVHDDAKSRGKGKSEPEAVELVRFMLFAAMRTRATDIHFEAKASEFAVRMRVDGSLIDATRMTKEQGSRILGVVKVLCEIDIGQRNIIQEGHFSVRGPHGRVDYRVSFTPSMHGQKLVIRVLDLENAPRYLHELNLNGWMLESIRRVSKQDAGMVLVCGPTGSGKTTTLYSVLRDIDARQRNVITIEDPVEYEISGITQIPISEGQGNTFSSLLRSVLRQDPDVLLVGEVRDQETAIIAMQSAMTGHLVLSTVHAKDTVGTIFRLLDLGVEPFLVASSLNLILAQRLIRMLCPHCRMKRKPTPQQLLKIGKHVEAINTLYYPVGCSRCLQTGFRGRRAIFEMLTMSNEIRDAILRSPTLVEIRHAMKMTVFSSLAQNGYQLVLDGTTSFEEIERVAGD